MVPQLLVRFLRGVLLLYLLISGALAIVLHLPDTLHTLDRAFVPPVLPRMITFPVAL